MSDDRNFVARWSRLKREADNDKNAPGPSIASPEKADEPEAARSITSKELGQPATPDEAFDVSSLPAIDSITANTDIRDFLRAGVPADLTKAALRRAWSEDTAIRDFIGIAENQWDFTDPTAIPGFGPLQAADNIHDLVAQAMGKLEDRLASPTDAVQSPATPDGASSSNERVYETQIAATEHAQAEVAKSEDGATGETEVPTAGAVAPQHESRTAEPKRRRHGRALPKPA